MIIAFFPFEFSCTSKQAPGCTYTQRNAHDCANYEIKGARIEQNLKCITHSHSSDADGIAAPPRSAALRRFETSCWCGRDRARLDYPI
jgi:hypothetical protein